MPINNNYKILSFKIKENQRMIKLKNFIWATALPLFLFGVVFAQRRAGDPSAGDAAAGCGICGAGLGAMILVPILLTALNIALLVWVARDAKARGMDNSVLWMALVLFTSVLGLIIYIFSRPQGELIQCPHCGNKRLRTSAKCPTCGNA